MHNHTFTWNGQCSEDFGVYIEKYPDLNRSARKFKSASVPGRNGNIYQLEEAWEEVTVSYQIFAGRRKRGAAVCSFTEIMEWLHSADGYAELSDSYDYDHYRLGVFVDDMDIESEWHQFGRATITFRCRPERYIVKEPIEVTSGDTITNPTNHIAKPIIELTGSGACSLMKLGSRSLYTAPAIQTYSNFSQLATLASNYLFWVAPGTGRSIIVHNTQTGGGTLSNVVENTGTITFTPTGNYGIGIIYPVNPSTTYTLSVSTNRSNCRVAIVHADSSYPFTISKVENFTVNGSARKTFTTSSVTGYVMFVFFGVVNQVTNFSSIMLNGGDAALPFKAYTDPFANTVQIGDTELQFLSSGFDTAEIDCERENFTLNGVNANTVASVTEGGGLTAEYLRIPPGNNEVTYSSEITSMTILPRFWEL